jgi:Cu(I)/Ag(I) efflux system membrane protein CusA/SilA
MKRIAAPMIGGLSTSFLMELLVYPAVYYLWRWHTEVKQAAVQPEPTVAPSGS